MKKTLMVMISVCTLILFSFTGCKNMYSGIGNTASGAVSKVTSEGKVLGGQVSGVVSGLQPGGNQSGVRSGSQAGTVPGTSSSAITSSR